MFTLSDAQKYRLYQVGSVIGLAFAWFFITHMSPRATQHYNKVRFAWLMISVIVCLWCAIAAIYYRSKIRNPAVDATPVNTLAAVGSQLKEAHQNGQPQPMRGTPEPPEADNHQPPDFHAGDAPKN
jgi:hypothetical protein